MFTCRSYRQGTPGGCRKPLASHRLSLPLKPGDKVVCATVRLKLLMVCENGGNKMEGLELNHGGGVSHRESAVGTPGRTGMLWAP